MNTVQVTPEVTELIAANAPVAIGVSGGKDSCALAFAIKAYLDEVGHAGPRLMIHSDLGVVEWADSLPTCERLAKATGMELVVVRRPSGDMMDRWEGRWKANVKRYANLECVRLILPWSTPSMRFCTSELKVDVITRYLKKRFPGQRVINATGIRREESAGRAKAPICKLQPKLKTTGGVGIDWHGIIEWKTPDVFGFCESYEFQMHEAYSKYKSSRVSCAFCIMATQADMKAALRDPRNHDLYWRMVNLEINSTFAFQSNKWLCDLFPTWDNIFNRISRHYIENRKAAAKVREEAEATIPKHLLYTKGWPTCVPTMEEAQILSNVRSRVATTVGLKINYTTPTEIINRYKELMSQKKPAVPIVETHKKSVSVITIPKHTNSPSSSAVKPPVKSGLRILPPA